MTFVCPGCQGQRWIDTGETLDVAGCCDIYMTVHKPCGLCGGQGIYVSRAAVGLRAPTPIGLAQERITPLPPKLVMVFTPTSVDSLLAEGFAAMADAPSV